MRKSTEVTFFINGVASGSYTTSVSAMYSNSDLVIGKDYRDNSNLFKGNIFYVKVYKSALNPGQLYAFYLSGLPTIQPTATPTALPSMPTVQPTRMTTFKSTSTPTKLPTRTPTASPTCCPIQLPYSLGPDHQYLTE